MSTHSFTDNHPPGLDGIEPRPTTWVVMFELASKLEQTNVVSSYDDQRLDQILEFLAPLGSTASLDGDLLVVTMSVQGFIDEGLARAKEFLIAAMEHAGVDDYQIVTANIVKEHDVLRPRPDQDPIHLLSVTEVAKKLGVSKQRVSAMVKSGRLPPPAARVGNAPGFLEEQLSDAIAERTHTVPTVRRPSA